MKTRYRIRAALATLLLLAAGSALAGPRIAVTPFELNDLTLQPRTPEEVERTASLKPKLEQALSAAGVGLEPVRLDDAAVEAASRGGFGYLFQHDAAAARLGQEAGADLIAVGRLHKPSFLFVYLMVHLIDADSGKRIGDYKVEIKGQQQAMTQRGVDSLARKIAATVHGRRAD